MNTVYLVINVAIMLIMLIVLNRMAKKHISFSKCVLSEIELHTSLLALSLQPLPTSSIEPL